MPDVNHRLRPPWKGSSLPDPYRLPPSPPRKTQPLHVKTEFELPPPLILCTEHRPSSPHVMLASRSVRPATTDLGFFSGPRGCKSIASITSNVVVTTRVANIVQPAVAPSSPFYPQPAAHKRKYTTDQNAIPVPRKKLRQPLSASNSFPKTKSVAKRRCGSSSGSSTRFSTPEPIYRNSRSRSVSVFASRTPRIARECWIEEDGCPGKDAVTSEKVVKELMKGYKQYFHNPQDPNDHSWEPHPTDYPSVELQYPNTYASEKFILLAPKDKDHYNPIMCLESSLYTIVGNYLTPEEQAPFGTLPNKDISLDEDDDSPSAPQASQSSSSSLSSAPQVNHLRAVQRAIHTRDGPLFIKSINAINDILCSLKHPRLPPDLGLFEPSPCNSLKETVKGWSSTGLPKEVAMRIIEETYQRCVGPKVRSLGRYEAFSSSVYGELMPSLISDVVFATGLSPSSLFMDLGSGVGNVVVQASLQSGCRSFGVENMPVPAAVARDQLDEIKRRCRMWGVSMGEVELEHGDMLQSARVSELMRQADVVLINNKIFKEELNEALKPKFLDLKEGAIVVSLKPFVSSINARVTERNVDDMSAIFDVTERPYHSGSVSWGPLGGTYYLHRVDREGYAAIRQKFEDSTASGRHHRKRR